MSSRPTHIDSARPSSPEPLASEGLSLCAARTPHLTHSDTYNCVARYRWRTAAIVETCLTVRCRRSHDGSKPATDPCRSTGTSLSLLTTGNRGPVSKAVLTGSGGFRDKLRLCNLRGLLDLVSLTGLAAAVPPSLIPNPCGSACRAGCSGRVDPPLKLPSHARTPSQFDLSSDQRVPRAGRCDCVATWDALRCC